MMAWKQIKAGSLSCCGKLLEGVSHFFTFAFLNRASTPSCVTSIGSVLPFSQSQYVRNGSMSNSAASDWVSPRRLRSDLIVSAKLMLFVVLLAGVANHRECALARCVVIHVSLALVAIGAIRYGHGVDTAHASLVAHLAASRRQSRSPSPRGVLVSDLVFIFHVQRLADSANVSTSS